MRVLVCGGRDYDDRKSAWKKLDELKPALIIHGGCSGADSIAGLWANSNGVPCMVFPAAWSMYASSAGPIRNKWMIEHGKPDLVLAFPGGRGTASMKSIAVKAGVLVEEAT